VSTTYPTGRRTRKLSVLEALGPVLREAGLVEPENYEFTGNARMVAAALALGLRQIESTDPWGDPFALVIRADWCSIDGTEPGDLQMRVSPYGVQIRERTPSTLACVELNHFSQTCENCWTTRMMNPETQWYSASERVQVRIDPIDEDATTCRAEIRRRIDQHHVQPEAVWSEPWAAPNYSSTEFHKEHRSNRNIDTTWVSVANDVQISEGHTFPRGVLVRQATGRDDTPWTTPRFLAETHWRWVDLIPDGSMQLRCWRPREEERNYGNSRIEVRQRVGRKPVLVAEPTWGKSKSGHFVERTEYSNGYALTLFLDRNRYGGYRGVEGLRVVTPKGRLSRSSTTIGTSRQHPTCSYIRPTRATSGGNTRSPSRRRRPHCGRCPRSGCSAARSGRYSTPRSAPSWRTRAEEFRSRPCSVRPCGATGGLVRRCGCHAARSRSALCTTWVTLSVSPSVPTRWRRSSASFRRPWSSNWSSRPWAGCSINSLWLAPGACHILR